MISNAEVAGLMVAVQRAGTSLSDEILQIIAASVEPMCCKDIYEKSVNAPDTMSLSIEVHRMTAKAGLLEIVETKKREGFRPVAFYRLTALGHEQLRTPTADAPVQKNTEISIPKVQPNTAKTPQEATMPKTTRGGKASSALNATLLELIRDFPGITQADLVRNALRTHPNETEKHIIKTLSNMQHSAKKIVADGPRGKMEFRIAGVDKPIQKPVEGTPAAIKPAPAPAVREQGRDDYAEKVELIEVLLSDDNRLFLTLGEEQFMLNPTQTTILHAFMQRVQLNVVPA